MVLEHGGRKCDSCINPEENPKNYHKPGAGGREAVLFNTCYNGGYAEEEGLEEVGILSVIQRGGRVWDKMHTGTKRDSVGWQTDLRKVPGNNRKRSRMRAERRTKRTRSRMKTMVPIVIKPRNLWGVTASKRATPPVLMVRVNHLKQGRGSQVRCTQAYTGLSSCPRTPR